MKPQFNPSRVPSRLFEKHAAGSPLALTGRFSKEYAFEEAVNDALAAADFLAECGIDIRKSIPAKAELIAQLKSTKPVKSVQSNGHSFVNWFLRIDLRASHGVIFVISCGTGTKLDDNEVQPYVNYMAEVVKQSGAIALFASRIDRMTRRAWAFGPVMLALQEQGGFLGDKVRGVLSVNGVESILIFFSAHAEEDEAAKMPAQMARGMRAATGSEMIDGRCPIGIAPAMPAGMFSYRSKQDGQLGKRILTFDTPSCLPDDREVAAGRPLVVRGDGTEADQVDNVRWVLAHMGKPRWTFAKLAAELVVRDFSTEQARRMGGMSARLNTHMAQRTPKQYLRPIINDLEFFETGILELNIGVKGFEQLMVTGCFPPDGKGWGEPEDFVRIAQWLDDVRPANSKGLSFAGVPVVVDGAQCLLFTRSFERPRGGRRYVLGTCLAEPYRENFTLITPKTKVQLPADLLPNAIADALINASEAVIALVPASAIEDISDGSKGELSRALTVLKVLGDERDTLRHQILERADEGTPILSGALLRELNERFNVLVDDEIPGAELHVELCKEKISSVTRQLAKSNEGVALEALLELVAALRDPHDLSYRDLIRSSVRNMVITSRKYGPARLGRTDLSIAFEFIITGGGRTVSIPVKTEFVDGTLYLDTEIGHEILETLKGGSTTFESIEMKNRGPAAKALAFRLGIPLLHCMLHNVKDPRLAQLVALVLDTDNLDEVADRTGEDASFLERIRSVHRGTTRTYWEKPGGEVMNSLYRCAPSGQPVDRKMMVPAVATKWASVHVAMRDHRFKDEWSYDYDKRVYTLKPCPHCGSFRRFPASIPEPVGLVCLECRKDQGGFIWPPEPYDRYRCDQEDQKYTFRNRKRGERRTTD